MNSKFFVSGCLYELINEVVLQYFNEQKQNWGRHICVQGDILLLLPASKDLQYSPMKNGWSAFYNVDKQTIGVLLCDSWTERCMRKIT